MIKLTIPESSPSANKAYGAHWTRKAKLRKHWGWLVRVARLEAAQPVHTHSHAYIQINRYGRRFLDFDNFVFGTKHLTDSLVAEGFAYDDSPDRMTVEYHQHIGTPHRTIINIWGLEEWNQESATKRPKSLSPATMTSSQLTTAIADALS